MRNDTTENEVKIAYDDRETREDPRAITGAIWATVALLFLIVILGVLFVNGFLSSIMSGVDNYPGQSDVRARP